MNLNTLYKMIQKQRYDLYFLGGAAGVLLLLTLVFGVSLYKTFTTRQRLDNQRENILSEIRYWQKITNDYKDYRDAYMKLALLEYQLKHYDVSREYLKKVLSLDPNFEKGRKLEELIRDK